ncbi:hypothetical protein, partial [uncultured Alistipes sp.]|uniref:hypothetical protein n=1 Tax=uncultured Alistipes sp. TaxID=538949 RepID=UPI00272C25FF
PFLMNKAHFRRDFSCKNARIELYFEHLYPKYAVTQTSERSGISFSPQMMFGEWFGSPTAICSNAATSQVGISSAEGTCTESKMIAGGAARDISPRNKGNTDGKSEPVDWIFRMLDLP